MPSLWTPEQTAFREEVRLFLRENLADETRQKVRKGLALSKDDHEKWHDALAAKGWYAGFWPEEYGGKGWDAAQKAGMLLRSSYSMMNTPTTVPLGSCLMASITSGP